MAVSYDSDGEDWNEGAAADLELCKDLLGSDEAFLPVDNLKRASEASGVDITSELRKLDVFDRIRFVNACRRTISESSVDSGLAAGVVRAMLADTASFVGNDDYMKPEIADDSMLAYVAEIDEGEEDEEYLDGSAPIDTSDGAAAGDPVSAKASAQSSDGTPASGAGASNAAPSASPNETPEHLKSRRSPEELREEIKVLQHALANAEQELARAGSVTSEGSGVSRATVGLRGDRPSSEYYAGYGDFGIHAEML